MNQRSRTPAIMRRPATTASIGSSGRSWFCGAPGLWQLGGAGLWFRVHGLEIKLSRFKFRVWGFLCWSLRVGACGLVLKNGLRLWTEGLVLRLWVYLKDMGLSN